MTATVHPADTATVVTIWLSEFGDALAAGDSAAAAALPQPSTRPIPQLW